MTWAEYQECYREALTLVQEQGFIVGRPFLNAEGGRSCKVSGKAVGDLEILTRAFGEKGAIQIFGEKIVDPVY